MSPRCVLKLPVEELLCVTMTTSMLREDGPRRVFSRGSIEVFVCEGVAAGFLDADQPFTFFLENAALQAPPKKLTEFLIFRVLIALRLPVVYNNRVIRGDGFLRGVDPSFITSVASLKEAPAHTRCLCLPGVTDYLSAEISTSKQKKFSLVTFVDTPGLVDGDMVYPFNVNSAITWLGTSLQRRV